MSTNTPRPQANVDKHIDYKLNRHIKLTLEDSMFRYHFTDSMMEPEVKKNDSLLKYSSTSRIEFLLKKCISYRSMQRSRVEKASGVSKARAPRRLSNDFFIKKTAARFSSRYIIKEKKMRLIDPSRKNPKPIPPIPDVPQDQTAWIGIELCDEQGNAVKNQRFELFKGDKKITAGSTDSHGMAKMVHLKPGNYNFTFPDLDKKIWARK